MTEAKPREDYMTEQTQISMDRRRFLAVAARYGFATAVLAATGGYSLG